MSSEDVVDERAQDRGPVHCAGSVLSRACVLQPAAGLRDCNIVSPPPRPGRPKLYFSPDSLLRAASKFFIAVMDREESSSCEKIEVAPGKSSRKSSTADRSQHLTLCSLRPGRALGEGRAQRREGSEAALNAPAALCPKHSGAAGSGSLGQLPGWDTGWRPPQNRGKIKSQQGRRSERPDPQPKALRSSPSPQSSARRERNVHFRLTQSANEGQRSSGLDVRI